MAMELCSRCGKKQFNPSSRKCYACRGEVRKDGAMVDVPVGYFLDTEGNLRTSQQYQVHDGKIFVSYHFLLEAGKTTLRGEFPKLAQPPKCPYAERLSCNHGEGFERCQYMKLETGRWVCVAGLG